MKQFFEIYWKYVSDFAVLLLIFNCIEEFKIPIWEFLRIRCGFSLYWWYFGLNVGKIKCETFLRNCCRIVCQLINFFYLVMLNAISWYLRPISGLLKFWVYWRLITFFEIYWKVCHWFCYSCIVLFNFIEGNFMNPVPTSDFLRTWCGL